MTDDQMNADVSAKPLFAVQVVAVVLAVAFAALTALVLGYRADLAEGITVLPVAFSLKGSFFVLLLLASIFCLRMAVTPMAKQGANESLFVMAIVAIMSAVVIETTLVSGAVILADFSATKPELCMAMVTLYGLVGAAVLLRVLRRYQLPVSQQAAAWAGLAAAAAGSLGYSVYCPSGSPVFVLVAYGAPCLLVSCVTALLAPRYLAKS